MLLELDICDRCRRLKGGGLVLESVVSPLSPMTRPWWTRRSIMVPRDMSSPTLHPNPKRGEGGEGGGLRVGGVRGEKREFKGSESKGGADTAGTTQNPHRLSHNPEVATLNPSLLLGEATLGGVFVDGFVSIEAAAPAASSGVIGARSRRRCDRSCRRRWRRDQRPSPQCPRRPASCVRCRCASRFRLNARN